MVGPLYDDDIGRICKEVVVAYFEDVLNPCWKIAKRPIKIALLQVEHGP
jgi:hypothetical protein